MNNQKADYSYSVKDWFFCDDIREEVYGKVSYMGVYGDAILFKEVPATLPKIFVYIKLELKKGTADKIFLRLLQPDDLAVGSIIEVKLPPTADPEKTHTVKLHIGFIPFNIQKTGLYKLQISFDGGNFDVLGNLNVGLMSG